MTESIADSVTGLPPAFGAETQMLASCNATYVGNSYAVSHTN